MVSSSDGKSSSRSFQNEDSEKQQEWLKRIAHDDHEAFKAVFQLYYPQLCSFAQRFVKSREIARELVQNVFEKLWKKRYELKIHTSLKAYLYRGVRNQALDFLKHQEVVRRWEEESKSVEFTQEWIDEEFHHEELLRTVERAIESLPDRRRLIFTLHWSEGLTYREIADVLELSIKTVEAQMGHALKTIRSMLYDYLPVFTFLLVI